MPSARPKPVFIRPSLDGFQVDAQLFAWGTTLADLDRALSAHGQRREGDYEDIPRGLCGSAYGFPAISFEPAFGDVQRPVRSVTYHLAPYDPKLEIGDPRWWADAIRATLGPPAEEYSADDEEREQAGEGTVFYNASWRLDGLEVGLSTFGGQRPESTGISAAYLYLTWTDDEAAAAPYVARAQQQQLLLDALATARVEWHAQVLRPGQYRAQTEDDAETRLRARALSTQPIYDTPASWARKLDDRQAALWVASEGRYWGLSTQHDTVFFERGQQDIEVQWHNVLPSRFGGYMELRVAGLCLLDDHSSASLTALAKGVARCLGRELDCQESRDNG